MACIRDEQQVCVIHEQKKNSERGEKSGSVANVSDEKKANGDDSALAWAPAATPGCRFCMLKRSEMLAGPFGLSGTMIQAEDHVGSLNSEVIRMSRSQKVPGGSAQMYSNCAQRSWRQLMTSGRGRQHLFGEAHWLFSTVNNWNGVSLWQEGSVLANYWLMRKYSTQNCGV